MPRQEFFICTLPFAQSRKIVSQFSKLSAILDTEGKTLDTEGKTLKQ